MSGRIPAGDDPPANIPALAATLKDNGWQISAATNGGQPPPELFLLRPWPCLYSLAIRFGVLAL